MFLKDEINRKRQIEVDMAKAVLIFFMPFVHVMIECTSDEGLGSGIPYLFDSVIGGPFGAPMFMFAMGIGMVYTDKREAQDFFRRGLITFGLAFLMSLCCYVIPYIIGYVITGEYDKFIETMPYRFLASDILQYAGLVFMLMALFVKLKIHKWAIWGLSFVMSVIAQFANGIDFKLQPLNIVFGYFVGTEDAAGKVCSEFPLFNWMIVVASGYVFGSYLIRTVNKKRFYLMISPLCIVATVAYSIYGISNEIGMFGEGENCYYHISTPDVLCAIVAALGALGIYYAISQTLSVKIKSVIYVISKNITSEYCIHWLFVVVITNDIIYSVYGTQELPVSIVLSISLGISIAAIYLANIWSSFRERR